MERCLQNPRRESAAQYVLSKGRLYGLALYTHWLGLRLIYTTSLFNFPNGTYNIINKTTGRYANLAEAVVASYTPVIAWNSTGTGGDNEKWVITSVPGGTYTIRSKLDPNAYASATTHAPGGVVANATQPDKYNIVQVTGGGYRISFTLHGIGWAHLNSTDADGIQIKLQPTGTANDVWNITPAV